MAGELYRRMVELTSGLIAGGMTPEDMQKLPPIAVDRQQLTAMMWREAVPPSGHATICGYPVVWGPEIDTALALRETTPPWIPWEKQHGT